MSQWSYTLFAVNKGGMRPQVETLNILFIIGLPTYQYQYEFMNSYFIQWIIIYYCHIFVFLLAQILPVAASSKWPLCPNDVFPSSLEHFCWLNQMFQAHLPFLVHSPWDQPFPPEAGSGARNVVFRTQNMADRCVYCYKEWLSPLLPQWTQQGNLCVLCTCIRSYMHTFVYFYIVHIYFTSVLNSDSIPHYSLYFYPFHILTSSLTLSYPSFQYLLISADPL